MSPKRWSPFGVWRFYVLNSLNLRSLSRFVSGGSSPELGHLATLDFGALRLAAHRSYQGEFFF